jgi:hypothetical protein
MNNSLSASTLAYTVPPAEPVRADIIVMQQQQPPSSAACSSSGAGGTGKEPIVRKMSAGHRMSTTPRKFAEKIAYLQRMNEAGQAQFDEVIRDVHALTGSTDPANPSSSATGSASMSLPNVHHVVSLGALRVMCVCTLAVQVRATINIRTACMLIPHLTLMPSPNSSRCTMPHNGHRLHTFQLVSRPVKILCRNSINMAQAKRRLISVVVCDQCTTYGGRRRNTSAVSVIIRMVEARVQASRPIRVHPRRHCVSATIATNTHECTMYLQLVCRRQADMQHTHRPVKNDWQAVRHTCIHNFPPAVIQQILLTKQPANCSCHRTRGDGEHARTYSRTMSRAEQYPILAFMRLSTALVVMHMYNRRPCTNRTVRIVNVLCQHQVAVGSRRTAHLARTNHRRQSTIRTQVDNNNSNQEVRESRT